MKIISKSTLILQSLVWARVKCVCVCVCLTCCVQLYRLATRAETAWRYTGAAIMWLHQYSHIIIFVHFLWSCSSCDFTLSLMPSTQGLQLIIIFIIDISMNLVLHKMSENSEKMSIPVSQSPRWNATLVSPNPKIFSVRWYETTKKHCDLTARRVRFPGAVLSVWSLSTWVFSGYSTRHAHDKVNRWL